MVKYIIDENLNRLREGLRVIDDCFRMSGNIRLSKYCCALRRKVSKLEDKSSPYRNRRASSDPGKKRYKTEKRKDIFSSNLRRCQEACRVLEETSKLIRPEMSANWQDIRFELYILESKIRRSDILKDELYLIITPKYCRESPEKTVEKACSSGIGLIQYREKHETNKKAYETAIRLREITEKYSAKLIIDDRPDLALMCEADGVHVGQDDYLVSEVRKIIGDNKIIGKSTHSYDQLEKVAQEDVDYIAYGPIISCVSKEKKEKISGFPETDRLKKIDIKVPLYLIGGINTENYIQFYKRGFFRLVFMTALTMNEDISEMIKNILKRRKKYGNEI